jgi:hypothetical protein
MVMEKGRNSFIRLKWIFAMIAGFVGISIGVLIARDSGKTKIVNPVKSEKTVEAPPDVEKNAEKLLRSMTDYLSQLKEFTFTAEGFYEYVLDSTKQKILINNNGKLYFKRPDKFKAERTNELSDAEFYYNGKLLTVYGKKQNYYAQDEVPSDLNKALDYSRDILSIETPAADLLYTDAYNGLMEDVISGQYLGKAYAGGKLCHHLAFRGNETDWQIWIEDGKKPLPRKYLITSKKLEGAPQYSIEIPEWNTDVKLSDQMFTFTPPKGATRIEFLKNTTEPVSSNK